MGEDKQPFQILTGKSIVRQAYIYITEYKLTRCLATFAKTLRKSGTSVNQVVKFLLFIISPRLCLLMECLRTTLINLLLFSNVNLLLTSKTLYLCQ